MMNLLVIGLFSTTVLVAANLAPYFPLQYHCIQIVTINNITLVQNGPVWVDFVNKKIRIDHKNATALLSVLYLYDLVLYCFRDSSLDNCKPTSHRTSSITWSTAELA